MSQMQSQVDAVLSALTVEGCKGVRGQMPALLDALQKPLEAAPTRRVLDELRSQCCFAAMRTFASTAARFAEGSLLVYVQRQLAQAMIELGDLGDAIALLQSLIRDLEPKGSPKDRSEVLGLQGRAWKQRF